MIELRDVVTIGVPPEEVWAWLERMPDHILEWHPDHLDARWIRGAKFEPGAVMEVREILHGEPHRLRMALVEAEEGRRVRYRILPGLRGEFLVDPKDGGAEFTAIIALGYRLPVVGPLIDWILRRVLGDRLQAIARHQAEEGANLKGLLERGMTSRPEMERRRLS